MNIAWNKALVLSFIGMIAGPAVAQTKVTQWRFDCAGDGQTHRGAVVSEVRGRIEIDFSAGKARLQVLEKTVPPFTPEVLDRTAREFNINWAYSGAIRKDTQALVLQTQPLDTNMALSVERLELQPVIFVTGPDGAGGTPEGEVKVAYRFANGYDDGSGERGPGNWVEKRYSRDLRCRAVQ